MIHNFVSVMECANRPGAQCVASVPGLVTVAIIIAAGVAGFVLKSRDAVRYAGVLRKLMRLSALLLVASIAAIAGFFLFDPDPILGVEDNAVVNGMWIAANMAFGLGLTGLICALAMILGGFVFGTRGSPGSS